MKTVLLTRWRALDEATEGLEEAGDLATLLRSPLPKPADSTRLPGWSPATFAQRHRRKANVASVTALVVDVDKGAVPLERVRVLFAGLSALVHCTRRSTPAVPRWRVAVEVSRQMTPEEHGVVWTFFREDLARRGLEIDPSTRDASRFWFLPCEPAEGPFVFDELEGAAIDVEAVLAAAKPSALPPVQANRAPAVMPYVTKALENACGAIATAPEGGRNALLFAKATTVFGYHVGESLAPDLARAALERAARAAGLEAEETRKTLASAWQQAQRDPRRVPEGSKPPSAARGAGKPPPSGWTGGATDIRNAERLVELHGADLRYIHAWGKWLVWSGARWVVDDTGGAMRCAIDTARRMAGEAGDAVKSTTDAIVQAPDEEARAVAKAENDRARSTLTWALKSQSAGHLQSMLTIAKADKRVSVTHEQLDADPMLLNVANGTLDLRTGELRSARREDLLTKVANVVYDADATCPTWETFLARAMAGDLELIAFLQRFVGYALTGSIDEHAVVFCYGGGQNGKSTFLGTIHAMLGDYAKPAPRGLLFRSRGERHPTELATLFGARFVTCSEIDEGQAFDEALVKDLTGGDPISARQMREDFWSFNPTHKFFLAGNHKPTVRGSDEGIWRRMRLVPWTVQIPPEERDTGLSAKLRAELPGILRWAVLGVLEWQRIGLGDPAQVRKATAAYRKESDPCAEFLGTQCVFQEEARVTRKALRESYETYAKDSGLMAVGAKRFSEALRERGAKDSNVRNYMGKTVHGWAGVRLMTDQELEFSGHVDTCGQVIPYTKLTIDSSIEANRNSVSTRDHVTTDDEPSFGDWLEGRS